MKKTNAARYLDRCKIAYELREYSVDENDLSALNVAGKVGLPLEQVFKTLAVRGDKTGVMMACIPGGDQLDLKALAVISHNKRIDMVSLNEIEPLTGYIRGGVSPIGGKKQYPVFMDQSALNYEVISVSAGIRGCQIFIEPAGLIKAVQAVTAKIVID